MAHHGGTLFERQDRMRAETETAAYPITPRNRVKRMHERASYDRQAVHAILDAAMLCTVAYVIDGQPYATPTLFWRKGDTPLLARFVGQPYAASSERPARGPASPVAHLDGLVLARSGFNHSANYRSAMCFGTARLVEDSEEKIEAMRGTSSIASIPGRSALLRPVTPQEAKATTIIAMPIGRSRCKSARQGRRRRRGGFCPADLGRRHPRDDRARRRRNLSPGW
jgi:nitroimidazol reductase NimA-like FMN-containing flavoprotein (pyridoxamine 5'-phosphate oxidase superfamily)